MERPPLGIKRNKEDSRVSYEPPFQGYLGKCVLYNCQVGTIVGVLNETSHEALIFKPSLIHPKPGSDRAIIEREIPTTSTVLTGIMKYLGSSLEEYVIGFNEKVKDDESKRDRNNSKV